MLKEYSFVLDKRGQRLDPTLVQNAWRLIRQKKAKLISKFPMVIQLNKVIENPNKEGSNSFGIVILNDTLLILVSHSSPIKLKYNSSASCCP